MTNPNRELWWLVALEATLFFSFPCWELTAIWAAPIEHPFRFGIALLATATVALLSCHVGPALFASRFHGPWPPVYWLLAAWLGFGYLEWIWTLAGMVVWPREPGLWSLALVAPVIIVAWIGSAWKPFVAIELLLAAAILVWALTTTWTGLWTHNKYFASPLEHIDWQFNKGILLSAAPAIVIAWRIGRLESRPSRVWLSGLVGVWLPLVVSVTIASLATEAGLNLYYHPSLGRSFNWALLGRNERLEPVLLYLSVWTGVTPALLAALSIRILTPEWGRKLKAWPVPAAICLLSYAASFMSFVASSIRTERAEPFEYLPQPRPRILVLEPRSPRRCRRHRLADVPAPTQPGQRSVQSR